MKHWIAAGIATATLAAASTAFAADIARPVYKAPPMVAPVYDWTGFYIGVNAGYTWSTNNGLSYAGTDTGAGGFGTALALGLLPNTGLKNDGFIGGGQIGYNWQSGVWVFGWEADFQWVNGGDNITTTRSTAVFLPLTSTISRDLEWFGTVRGRVGVLVAPTLLAYATGGLAYGNTSLTTTFAGPTFVPPLFTSINSSGTSTGWTVGGGLEWALGNGWSVKGEYLYYDLGSENTFAAYTYGANNSTLTTSIDNTGHIVRAGLNYKFGYGKAPVVARY
jgi:outer membrane immunogenic protein